MPMNSQNFCGNTQCYTLLTYGTVPTQNIFPILHRMKDGLMLNLTSHIYENLVLLFGSCYKDKKNNGKCYLNQNAKFMLATMKALELSNITTLKRAKFLPLATSVTLTLQTILPLLNLSNLH